MYSTKLGCNGFRKSLRRMRRARRESRNGSGWTVSAMLELSSSRGRLGMCGSILGMLMEPGTTHQCWGTRPMLFHAPDPASSRPMGDGWFLTLLFKRPQSASKRAKNRYESGLWEPPIRPNPERGPDHWPPKRKSAPFWRWARLPRRPGPRGCSCGGEPWAQRRRPLSRRPRVWLAP